MVVNKAFIENLRESARINIPMELETFLLQEYEEEPYPYEYSEQDLYEQIRKTVKQYHTGLIDVTPVDGTTRMKQRYEALKDDYAAAMFKIRELEDEVTDLKKVLQDHGVVFSNSNTF